MSTMRSRTGFTPVLLTWASLASSLAFGMPAAEHKQAAEMALRVVGLRTEYKESPLGIDAR